MRGKKNQQECRKTNWRNFSSHFWWELKKIIEIWELNHALSSVKLENLWDQQTMCVRIAEGWRWWSILFFLEMNKRAEGSKKKWKWTIELIWFSSSMIRFELVFLCLHISFILIFVFVISSFSSGLINNIFNVQLVDFQQHEIWLKLCFRFESMQ